MRIWASTALVAASVALAACGSAATAGGTSAPATAVGPTHSATATASPPTLSPSPSPTPDPTAGWKTATNTQAGYTVSFPPDFTHLPCPGGFAAGYVYQPALGHLTCPVPEAYPQVITISVGRNIGTAPVTPTPSPCLTVTLSNLTIDGLPAVREVDRATGACASNPAAPSQTETTAVTYTITGKNSVWTVFDYTSNNDTTDIATFDLIATHMTFQQ